MAEAVSISDKKPIDQLCEECDQEQKFLMKKLESIVAEIDYYRDIGSDGSSFWIAYLMRMCDLMAEGNFTFDRFENVLKMKFEKLQNFSYTYDFIKEDAAQMIESFKKASTFTILGSSTETYTILASWMKQATIGYILQYENRFNRWLTKENFYQDLRNHLDSFALSPNDTLIGAFAELFQLNVRIFPLNNAPPDEFLSYAFNGQHENSGSNYDFLVLQEDSQSGYKYRLLYQDSEDLPVLSYNVIDTRSAFNGMSSISTPNSAPVPCASSPDGTVVEELNVPYLTEKKHIEELLAEYNLDNSPEFFKKISDITNRYKYIRRTKGDGACFWRCVLISIAEMCNRDPEYLKKVKKISSDYLVRLASMDFDMGVADEFFEVFNDEMLKPIEKGDFSTALSRVGDHNYHLYFITCLKMITSGFVLEHEEDYVPNAVAEGFPTLRAYVDSRIQNLEMPADDIGIYACARVFDLNIRVEYVCRDNRGMNERGSYYLLPYDDENAEYNVFFLWRPEHYDILYKE